MLVLMDIPRYFITGKKDLLQVNYWNHSLPTIKKLIGQVQQLLNITMVCKFCCFSIRQLLQVNNYPKIDKRWTASSSPLSEYNIDLFWKTWQSENIKFPDTHRHMCFIFELCHPEIKRIVKYWKTNNCSQLRYSTPRLVLHGARDLITLKEMDINGLVDLSFEFAKNTANTKEMRELAALATTLNPISSRSQCISSFHFVQRVYCM